MTSEDAVPKRPGWLVLFTWGAFLCTLPSALWRVAMIMGWLPGTSELRARELGSNAVDGYLYVYALSIVQRTPATSSQSPRRESNPRPLAYKASALAAELRRQVGTIVPG